MYKNSDILRSYERFERLMDEYDIWKDPDVTFRDVCARIKADEDALDSIIFKEMGCSGADLLNSFRKIIRFAPTQNTKNYKQYERVHIKRHS